MTTTTPRCHYSIYTTIDIACINEEEATGWINEEAIGAISEVGIGAIIEPRIHLVSLFQVLLFQ